MKRHFKALAKAIGLLACITGGLSGLVYIGSTNPEEAAIVLAGLFVILVVFLFYWMLLPLQ